MIIVAVGVYLSRAKWLDRQLVPPPRFDYLQTGQYHLDASRESGSF
jgi:hypothetical protein